MSISLIRTQTHDRVMKIQTPNEHMKQTIVNKCIKCNLRRIVIA